MRTLNNLAWRGVRANRARSILSVLAIMIGVAVTIAGSMVGASVRTGILQLAEVRVVMEGIVGMLDPMLLFTGTAVQLAAGFLIFNTFSMAITRQRQQIGGWRSLGMTRTQVLRVILTEALILAVVGVTLGAAVSPLLGQGMISLIKHIMGQILAFGDAAPSLPVIAFAVVMGIGITLLSVLIPARRAARIAPLAALCAPEPANIERAARWQTALGGLIAGGLLVIVIAAPPGNWVQTPVDVLLTIGLLALWLAAVLLILPAVIGVAARMGRRMLPGAAAQIMTDNLRRARARVTLTAASLTFALILLIGLTGFMQFFFTQGFVATFAPDSERQAMFVSRFDLASGWGRIMAQGFDHLLLNEEETAAILDAAAGRAYAIPFHFAIIPELSFITNSFFTYVVDPAVVRDSGALVTFSEGSWETALPLMRDGCGTIVSPSIAARHNAGLGDTIQISGLDGMIPCTIAGIGMTAGGASILSDTVRAQVTDMPPVLVYMIPYADAGDALDAALAALRGQHPGISVMPLATMGSMMDESMSLIAASLNAMLVLALLTAAFGVANTVMLSVEERRHEIGLLRALGMTQRQIGRVIVGEAALLGMIGGVIGFAAGIGAVLILVLTYGLNSFGMVSPDLHGAALDSVTPTLVIGGVGVISTPLIAAATAWLSARRVIHEAPAAILPQSG